MLRHSSYSILSRPWHIKGKRRNWISFRPSTITYLDHTFTDDDDEETTVALDDPQDQANLMGSVWGRILSHNNSRRFDNNHYQEVTQWVADNAEDFAPLPTIDTATLGEDHPLVRPITLLEMTGVIRGMRNKAPGPSGITAKQVKYLPANYKLTLLNIFNAVLASGHFPAVFKTANMVFIAKPGKDKHDPQNYRPISLLEVIGKVFEKILSNRLNYYMEYHHLFTEKQFGFRSHRSTQHAINIIYDAVDSHRRQGNLSLIATRDVHKAFDSLWHDGLMYKLADLPDHNWTFLRLVYNFLRNRSVIPSFNRRTAVPFTPTAGVPQGSCLSPILFNIFVNDLPQPEHRDTVVTQFADDVIHVVSSTPAGGRKHVEVIAKMNDELNRTARWEKKWRITTNPDKIQISPIGCYPRTIADNGGIRIRGTPVAIKTSNKLLGYEIDRLLHSTKHVTDKANLAKARLSQLYRFKDAPAHIKKHLYKMMIRPMLEYPCVPLSLTTNTNTLKLQRVQNRALRFISNTRLNDRIRMEDLHTLHGIDALNVRIDKLKKRQLYTMNELYLPDRNNPPHPINTTDYVIREPPHRTHKMTLQEKVRRRIHTDGYPRPMILSDIPEDPEDWPRPDPVFIASR